MTIVGVWGNYPSGQKFGPVVMPGTDLAAWMIRTGATVHKVQEFGKTADQNTA